MDGKTEDKIFAPGYGEFFTADGKDVEALALAVPTDATTGSIPQDLVNLESGAIAVFDAAGIGDWTAASAAVRQISAAWDHLATGEVPRLVAPAMAAALGSLGRAVEGRDAARSRQAAIEVAQSTLDLQLRYRPAVEVNLARLRLWAARTQADADGRDVGGMRGDVFTLVYIRDRILGALSDADMTRVNTALQALQVAATDGAFGAAARGATHLRDLLATLQVGT